jgi:hypothetical protein
MIILSDDFGTFSSTVESNIQDFDCSFLDASMNSISTVPFLNDSTLVIPSSMGETRIMTAVETIFEQTK